MADGRFELGQSGNPAGRPKGIPSGRMKALREKPLWFFTNIVMPLLPRETRAAVEAGDKVIEWRGLLSVGAGEDR